MSHERAKEPRPYTRIHPNFALNMMRSGLLIPTILPFVPASGVTPGAPASSPSSQVPSSSLPIVRARSSSSVFQDVIAGLNIGSIPSVLSPTVPTVVQGPPVTSSVRPSLLPPSSLPSSSARPSASTSPQVLFRQAQGLPSLLGHNYTPSYGFLQLKDSLATSWLQSKSSMQGKTTFDQSCALSLYMGNLAADLERQNKELKNQLRAVKAASPTLSNEVIQLQQKISSQVNQMTLLEKDLQHHRQMLGVKEEEKKTLELQIQSLSSQLSVEVAKKNKAILDATLKSYILEHFQTSRPISPDSAQELASQIFELLQLQEKLKAQDLEIDFLTQELECTKTERTNFEEESKCLASELQVYKEGKEEHWEVRRQQYLSSSEFKNEFASRIVGTLTHSADGVLKQLREGGFYLKSLLLNL
ncbi:uncharacterized protein LOC122034000 [Zingiber officinale]|uniref:uncharacterized protein LOC122034000 n=1 Tax=Zingiber officinale TaxID=94328 RepID=UPI001C4A8DE7|nr:uncharacterized protein LOC122034000 [Zingiber officinale]